MNEHKTNNIYIFLPLIIAGSLIVGILISSWVSKSLDEKVIFKTVEQDKLSIILNYVANEYVDKIKKDELIEKVIPGILNSLDPHSVYINAKKAFQMREELEGEFDGIGVQFNIFRDSILVINTIPEGPSENIGILSGDRIVEIDDTIVANINITNSQVMRMLKGERGTFVNIKVFRKGHENLIPFRIKRGHIPIKSIDAEYIIDDKIGYIKINNFSRTTHRQFVEAILNIKSRGNIESIILDLRDNAGGYLNAATNIVDEFLSDSKLLVYTEGQARPRQTFFSTNNRNACQDLNVAILINEFSASAAEIIAGAIQDNDRGFVIGRRSFGKGLVQEAIGFKDGSLMRLTTARYYTPSGRSIQKKYDENIDDYYLDILNRYEHGEFLEKDSIQFDDSLIFFTAGGRKVYGGGGIMPDVFVPADTSGYTNLLGNIRRNNYDYFFAIDYVDINRIKLSKFNNANELIKYLEKNNVISQFYSYIQNENITIKNEELFISGNHIKNSVYAYIVRQKFGNNAFYELFNQHNNTIDKAIEILNSNITVFDL